MTTTHVQLFATAGPQAAAGQGPGMVPGLDGLFAQLMQVSQSGSQPLTISDAANIAGNLPPAITQNLPTDAIALKDLLSQVKQALNKGNVTEAAALLSAPQTTAEPPDTTLQNLPTETAPTRIATAKVTARSTMATFQPQDVMSLLHHETLVLQSLGHGDIDLTQGFDPAELAEIYQNAGLTPEEAAARVDIISKMVQHITTTPDQPLVILLPINTATSAPKDVAPLPTNKQDFLSAIQAAAQTVSPDSEEVVSQILALESIEGEDESGDPITKTVNVPLIQNLPVTTAAVAPENEAKSVSEALADIALAAKPTGMQTRVAAPGLEQSASTPEGQIVDTALNNQPAAHLLASVESSDVTNGVATHSGAAVAVAAYSEGGSNSSSDERYAPQRDVDGITRTGTETNALSFDYLLGQKLETQMSGVQTYNAHGKIPTPAEQVDIFIRQLADNGGGEVRIKLMPEELGSVDVRLQIHNGQVRGVVLVERPEVLHDLARDLKHLQQALAATGLNMADNALSFQMQNQGGDQGQSRDNHHAPLGGVAEVASGDEVAMASPGPWRDVTKLVDVNI